MIPGIGMTFLGTHNFRLNTQPHNNQIRVLLEVHTLFRETVAA
jgi:hypothetical protein